MSVKIIKAQSAGFCFGVERAVNMAKACAENSNGKVYMLGPVIHNQTVIDELLEKGVILINSISEIETDQNNSVIIRAHGLPKKQYEEISQLGLKIIDTTCPFVKKTHRIVNEQSLLGDIIFIIGDKNHPEVIGIKGWCKGEVYIFNCYEDLVDFLTKNPKILEKNISVVAQTTINRENFEKCSRYLNKEYTTVKIFDTICKATDKRQHEAAQVAKLSDLMIVAGSKYSSNTRKLFEICKKFCPNSYFIENTEKLIEILKLNRFKDGNLTIGFTAGASTPACIIKEVINIMSEEKNLGEGAELNFAEAFEQSIKTLNTGDVVTGVIIAVTPTEVQVDLGTKHDGYIPLSEITDDPSVNVEEMLKPGQEIEVFVVRVNDVEGTVMLSKKKIDSIKGWKEIEKSEAEGTVLEGTVTEAVKGGVIMMVNGTRVFIPASLADLNYVADLNTLVGAKRPVKIIEINRQRRRVTGSTKAVLEEERRIKAEAIWAEIEEGREYNGIVKSITPYGVFVDIGGVDGMVHISELSWKRVRHPSDIVKVGDMFDVFVLSFDKETKKISLGHKRPDENPWEIFKNKYNVGDIVNCKIVKFMPFGAFAEIISGIDGLIHISQIAPYRIARPDEVLTIGQQVDAKISDIDWERKKVNLTIKGIDANPEPKAEKDEEKDAE